MASQRQIQDVPAVSRRNLRTARSLIQLSMNPVELAGRYLSKPIQNSLRFAVANLLSKLPLFPAPLRKSLLRSAAKRDRDWLSRRLLELAKPDCSLQRSEDCSLQRSDLSKDRQSVAGSEWHLALLKALEDSEVAPKALPTISVSFVTYNSAFWLPELFNSLIRQSYPISRLNLFFVDHDSRDDTVAMIKRFRQEHGAGFCSVTIHQQANIGFGMGHDYTFRNSADEFVLVSNVDLRFHERSLLDVVKVAQGDNEDVASWELRQCPFEHPKYYDPVMLETSWSSYACILVRRSAYLKVGGFEEHIFMYGEDVELSYRLRGAGYRLRYLPQVTVTHHIDFEDTELRPHQLSGSVAANVLLRYRYGSMQSAKEGMQMLGSALATESDSARRAALETALAQVKRDQNHFKDNRRPRTDAGFPFNGFDYDIARRGHDTALDSSQPLDEPLVSVVTRTFGPNVGLLREAIASVCNQSYRRIEHIIVEDRTSFAETLVAELREAYGRDIRYIRSVGEGRSPAGNTGLKQSRGKLLMFLDNDDLLFADHVEILVRALLAYPDAPAAYSLGWETPTFYDQNGRYREDAPHHVLSHAIEFQPQRLKQGNFMPIQNVLFRRALFETYGGFDPEIDHLEDWNLWCRYSQAGPFHYVPKTTAMYRVPGDIMFRRARERVMLAAEDAVRVKNALCFRDVDRIEAGRAKVRR